MATNDYNSVPLGQAGTGSAFILGNSQAANQFVANQARNQQIAYQNELAKQKLAAEQAALWDKNALKVAGGLYWKPEFDQRSQEHIQRGIQLRQQGINPYAIDYSNPEKAQLAQDYLLERQAILRDDANRKALETEIGKRFQAIQANPSKYDPEYIQQINKIVETPYSQVANQPLPTPMEAFNVDRDLVAKLDPVTFQTSKVVGNTKMDERKMLEEPTKRNIETLIADTETGKRWIKRQTGLTPSEARDVPNTFEENKKDLLKRYKGDPQLREQLAAQYGITGEGQELDDLLNVQAQQRVQAKQAYNSVINQYTELARGKANEFLKTNPDYSLRNQQRQDERLALARQRNARAEANAGGGSKPSDDVLYRQQTVKDMLNNKPGSGERLKSVLKGTGNYTDSELDSMIGAPKGSSYIEFRIPNKTITSVDETGKTSIKVRPAYEVLINKNDPNSEIQLNQLLSDLTGERVSEGKYQTGNASTKITNGVSTEQNKTLPKSVTNKFKDVPKGGF